MASLPPMDRSVTKLTTLDQQGLDSGVPDVGFGDGGGIHGVGPGATPAECLLMVWPLTLTAWDFKEPNVAQPRLERHVTRVIRREN